MIGNGFEFEFVSMMVIFFLSPPFFKFDDHAFDAFYFNCSKATHMTFQPIKDLETVQKLTKFDAYFEFSNFRILSPRGGFRGGGWGVRSPPSGI